MGQEDAAMNDRNLKPHDEDSDFPEFEFPVRDSVDLSPVLSERIAENGNGGQLRLTSMSRRRRCRYASHPRRPPLNRRLASTS